MADRRLYAYFAPVSTRLRLQTHIFSQVDQRGVVEIVRKLQKELVISVLFSAHELNPLLNSIDRVLYLGGGSAVLGAVDEVITSAVLSRLYGSDIEVLRVDGRIFVMAGEFDIERDDHRHHNHAGHGDTSPRDSRSSHV